MVNQLLAGVYIASAAEAMAFGARLGLHTRLLFGVIANDGGTSWVFGNRGPHTIENDYMLLSAVDIFVKDLGIVSHEASSRRILLHIANIAHQLFLSANIKLKIRHYQVKEAATKAKHLILLSGLHLYQDLVTSFIRKNILWPGLHGKTKYDFAKTYCNVGSVHGCQGKVFQNLSKGVRLEELNALLKQTVTGSNFDFKPYVLPICNAMMVHLTNLYQDQEVKECAIT